MAGCAGNCLLVARAVRVARCGFSWSACNQHADCGEVLCAAMSTVSSHACRSRTYGYQRSCGEEYLRDPVGRRPAESRSNLSLGASVADTAEAGRSARSFPVPELVQTGHLRAPARVRAALCTSHRPFRGAAHSHPGELACGTCCRPVRPSATELAPLPSVPPPGCTAPRRSAAGCERTAA